MKFLVATRYGLGNFNTQTWEPAIRPRRSKAQSVLRCTNFKICRQQNALWAVVSNCLWLVLENQQHQPATEDDSCSFTIPVSAPNPAMMLFFSPILQHMPYSPEPSSKANGKRQSDVFRVLSSLTSVHSSTHRALCYSSRHRHEGHIKMSQASSSYLSFPQIHLSAFKQQSMQLTEKWFLMASPVTRATRLLDSTTVSTVIPINTVQCIGSV